MKSILITIGLAWFSIPAVSQAGDKIGFHHLPPPAQAAVYRAAPRIRVTEVEVEKKRGWTVFEVEGYCRRFEYEIKVTPHGQILKFDRDER